jgi:hypothetical protein
MQADDFTRFRALMTGMAEMYQRELSSVLLDAYWISLRDWSLENFEAAAGQLMRTSSFMPRPADFTNLVKAGRKTAGEAWLLALDFARNGYSRWDSGPVTQTPGVKKPDDPILTQAVRAIGGYEAIAMSPTDKTVFLEKRFCEHYEAMQEANEVREAVPQIAQEQRHRLEWDGDGDVH